MRPIRSGEPHTLFEITTRTEGGAKRLPPSPEVTNIILGCIGRAQQVHPVEIFAFIFLSNHYHMLASAVDAKRMSSFMCHLNGNISRNINRLYQENGHLWHRRFRAIPVEGQDDVQIGRLRYIVRHGVKERLVARCRDWPGASSLPWLLDGDEIKGTWHNATAEYRAKRKANYVEKPGQFDTVYTIKMSPLPCWKDLEESVWRQVVAEMTVEVEREMEEKRKADGREGVKGVAALLRQDRHKRPRLMRRSPAPCVHTSSKLELLRWKNHFRALRRAYDEASRRFREGEHAVEFPLGTFRPQGAFVSWPEGGDEVMVLAA